MLNCGFGEKFMSRLVRKKNCNVLPVRFEVSCSVIFWGVDGIPGISWLDSWISTTEFFGMWF